MDHKSNRERLWFYWLNIALYYIFLSLLIFHFSKNFHTKKRSKKFEFSNRQISSYVYVLELLQMVLKPFDGVNTDILNNT